MNRPVYPSIRVTDDAASHSLGIWERSDRMRRRTGRRSDAFLGPALLVLGSCIVLAGFVMPGPHLLMVAVFFILGFCALLPGAMNIYGTLHRLRTGPLIMHRFEDGFVVERARGAVRAVPFAQLRDATLMRYASDHEHIMLRMTHRDGTVWVIPAQVTPDIGDPVDALEELGDGAGATHETVPYFTARQLLHSTPPWTGRRGIW